MPSNPSSPSPVLASMSQITQGLHDGVSALATALSQRDEDVRQLRELCNAQTIEVADLNTRVSDLENIIVSLRYALGINMKNGLEKGEPQDVTLKGSEEVTERDGQRGNEAEENRGPPQKVRTSGTNDGLEEENRQNKSTLTLEDDVHTPSSAITTTANQQINTTVSSLKFKPSTSRLSEVDLNQPNVGFSKYSKQSLRSFSSPFGPSLDGKPIPTMKPSPWDSPNAGEKFPPTSSLYSPESYVLGPAWSRFRSPFEEQSEEEDQQSKKDDQQNSSTNSPFPEIFIKRYQ